MERGRPAAIAINIAGSPLADDAETADQSVAGREGFIQSIHHCQPLSIPINNSSRSRSFPPFISTVAIHRQISFSPRSPRELSLTPAPRSSFRIPFSGTQPQTVSALLPHQRWRSHLPGFPRSLYLSHTSPESRPQPPFQDAEPISVIPPC